MAFPLESDIKAKEQQIDPLQLQLQQRILRSHLSNILIATSDERDRNRSLFLDEIGNWDRPDGEDFTIDDLLAKFAAITDPGYNAILDAELEEANREYQIAGEQINNRIVDLFNKKRTEELTEEEQLFYDTHFVLPTTQRNARYTQLLSEYVSNPVHRHRLLTNLIGLMESQV